MLPQVLLRLQLSKKKVASERDNIVISAFSACYLLLLLSWPFVSRKQLGQIFENP